MKHKFLLVIVVIALFAIPSLQVTAQDPIGTEITSITTVSSTQEGATFEGVVGDSEFADGTFTVTFLGLTEAITEIQFDGGSAVVADAIPATASVRRGVEDDTREVHWYMGNNQSAASTFVLSAPGPMTTEEHFNGNNVLAGVDNTFTNTGATVGETPFTGNQAIERIDYVLESSVSAADNIGFAVLERGPSGHDGFGIAAITAVDDAGIPTAFGPLFQIPAGEWGNTILVHTPYFVITNLEDGSGGTPVNPTLTGSPQTVGGIVFRTSELVEAGTDVYGYAVVGPDVTCSAEELVDVTAECYPADTGNPGGIDFIGMNLGALTLN